MKFSEFLIEENLGRRKIISREEAKETIRNNCMDMAKKYVNEKQGIFRGTWIKNDFLFGDTSTRVRKSRNTYNYYTLIMDNSQKWKKFPKRSDSFICSSSCSYASDFGKLYVAFPIDGTKIGICPNFDIWTASEHEFGGDYSLINNTIKGFANDLGVKINDDDYKSFLYSIDELTKKIKMDKMEAQKLAQKYKKITFLDSNKIIEKIIKNVDNIKDTIESFFSPKEFELQTTKNFNPPNNREIWFSGKCVFVTTETMEMGPLTVNDYYKNKNAGNIDIKDMSINEFIKAL